MQQPFHALSYTYYEIIKPISSALPAQSQPGSGHLIKLSIVEKMSLFQYLTTPMAVTFQARPRKCNNLFMLYLIHTMKW